MQLAGRQAKRTDVLELALQTQDEEGQILPRLLGGQEAEVPETLQAHTMMCWAWEQLSPCFSQ